MLLDSDVTLTSMNDQLPPAPKGKKAKSLGAYYTPDPAVEFMIGWAIKDSSYKVIDPSFGNGQFLKASASKVELDNPSEQIYGIELDTETFIASKQVLETHYNIFHLWNADFFKSDKFFKNHFGPKIPVESFEAVVGNPPFIRYQTFKGEERDYALQRAREHGVELPGHASSWAPFLVHAVSLIKPEGRLAMVVPAELSYAAYAKNVLNYLLEQFASLTVLTFQKRLFPKLGEDTFIVLGDTRGHKTKDFSLVDIEKESRLENFTGNFESIGQVRKFQPRELASLKNHKTKLLEYLLGDEPHALYTTLKEKAGADKPIKVLGGVAKVGIGYVTGDNKFFHPSAETIEKFGIPEEYLEPCVRRSNNLRGLFITEKDWASDTEPKKWLLNIASARLFSELPKGVQRYLKQGKEKGILERFKVRDRDPWYSVPHVKRGDAFLTYMSNGAPRLVHNPLGLPAPNSLHIVNLEEKLYDKVEIKLLVVAWYTSLTFLSAEIEGHSLGGGMLKLEPSEAKKVLIALPNNTAAAELDKAYKHVDERLRENDLEAALDVGDKLILRRGLKLKARECKVLRQGYHYLRDRRMNR